MSQLRSFTTHLALILLLSACSSSLVIGRHGAFATGGDYLLINGIQINPSSRVDNGPIRSKEFSSYASSFHFDTSIDVNFVVQQRRGVYCVIRGPSSVIEAMDIENHGNIFSISDPQGLWVINQPIQITIYIPSNNPLRIASTGSSDIIIPSTNASLDLRVTGAGNVRFGHVARTKIHVTGSGSVSGQSVSQELEIRATGHGNIRVQEAKLNNLTIAISGSGNAKIGGYSQDATLKITGAGNISVGHVTNHPRISVIGAGNVSVGNWL